MEEIEKLKDADKRSPDFALSVTHNTLCECTGPSVPSDVHSVACAYMCHSDPGIQLFYRRQTTLKGALCPETYDQKVPLEKLVTHKGALDCSICL